METTPMHIGCREYNGEPDYQMIYDLPIGKVTGVLIHIYICNRYTCTRIYCLGGVNNPPIVPMILGSLIRDPSPVLDVLFSL